MKLGTTRVAETTENVLNYGLMYVFFAARVTSNPHAASRRTKSRR